MISLHPISRTEMAARFRKHRRRLVEDSSLAEAVRGCTCFKLIKQEQDIAAIAIEFEASEKAHISLAVSQNSATILDDLESAARVLCEGKKTCFHTKRSGMVKAALQRRWLANDLGRGITELSKVY